MKGRSHTILAEVEIPPEGAQGALLAMGSILGGYSLYVADDRLQYVHNYLGREEHHVVASEPLTPGEHRLGFQFDCAGRFEGGNARLTVDDRVVAEAAIPCFVPVKFSITDAGLTCGEDTGSAVTRRYRPPFRFTGTLRRVTVDVEGPPNVDPFETVESRLRTQ